MRKTQTCEVLGADNDADEDGTALVDEGGAAVVVAVDDVDEGACMKRDATTRPFFFRSTPSLLD